MKKNIESLTEYATDELICSFVAKERGKCASKRGKRADKGKKAEGRNQDKPRSIFDAVHEITPPHRQWIHPGKGKMPRKGEKGLEKWTSGKKRAAARVLAGIKLFRPTHPADEWVTGLNSFIDEIQDLLAGNTPLVLETPGTCYKFKKAETPQGPFIYRPISIYSDLKTKAILSLACNWFQSFADCYFGDHMLFMRKAKKRPDKSWTVPNFLDAIDRISEYRKQHENETIYVGECDIQKFYDIFNHDDIIACFEELFDEIKESEGVADEVFTPFRRVLKAYLDSYSFTGEVLGKNGDEPFWKQETARLSKTCTDPQCLFKWVSEDDFICSGCYTPEEFDEAKVKGKIGIPQGGSLSCLIVNVVMLSIDKKILSREDHDRLFIRYCDDIILMNTDKDKCLTDLEIYKSELTHHRLIYHPFKKVSEMKRGRRNRLSFWEAKSKEPYLWGPGKGDASNWIAFVGYEMHRNGEIRLRKDKVEQEFRRIKRAYYSTVKMKEENRTEEEFIKKFENVAPHLLDFEKATRGRFIRSQAKRLDKHLIWNARKAAKKIGLPKSAADAIATYSKVLEES